MDRFNFVSYHGEVFFLEKVSRVDGLLPSDFDIFLNGDMSCSQRNGRNTWLGIGVPCCALNAALHTVSRRLDYRIKIINIQVHHRCASCRRTCEWGVFVSRHGNGAPNQQAESVPCRSFQSSDGCLTWHDAAGWQCRLPEASFRRLLRNDTWRRLSDVERG